MVLALMTSVVVATGHDYLTSSWLFGLLVFVTARSHPVVVTRKPKMTKGG